MDTEKHDRIKGAKTSFRWQGGRRINPKDTLRVLELPKEVLVVMASGCRGDEASRLLKWKERKASW